MITVLESLNLSTDFLEKKGIESPRLNAQLLLAEILNCKKLDLYLKFDRPLSEEETEKYRSWVLRRSKFEPLQYIIGKVEFYGLPFKVTPDVLIPRPETEILVEEVINFCKNKKSIRILDIGTGSGNIPVALAKNMNGADITAIDISEKAITIAKENANVNSVENKINFITADVNSFSVNDKFDCVISNPPYVSKEEFQTLQQEIKDYEPRIAVTDSNDGLDFYRVIAAQSKKLLKPGGKIFLEVGKDQSGFVKQLFEQNGFINVQCVKDLPQIERVVSGELK